MSFWHMKQSKTLHSLLERAELLICQLLIQLCLCIAQGTRQNKHVKFDLQKINYHWTMEICLAAQQAVVHLGTMAEL